MFAGSIINPTHKKPNGQIRGFLKSTKHINFKTTVGRLGVVVLARRSTNSKTAVTTKKCVKSAAKFAQWTTASPIGCPATPKALDPLHHERQWVLDSVGHFYREQIISDVTRLVKGGKEANVYACTAHPATGLEMIAAKLYRPRELRHLKNDAIYKAGRQLRGCGRQAAKRSASESGSEQKDKLW